MKTPKTNDPPVVSFFTLISDCRPPQRADRAAAGTLPTRAFRHCEALCAASSFGWYLFLPITFSLIWDGTDVAWTYEGAESWFPLKVAQYPGFSRRFDEVAPPNVKTFAPPFLVKFREPDIIQIWTGVVARTAPGWSLLIRPLANLPKSNGYELYEGIVETDRWFGPLFTNIRLTRTDAPIEFSNDFPFAQVQPIPRSVYSENSMKSFTVVADMTELQSEDWEAYYRTVVKPCSDPDRQRGRYASETRRRGKSQDTETEDSEVSCFST